MSDAVRVTHYKVVWEAGKVGGIVVLQDDDGAQHDVTVKDSSSLAALIATLRSETNLIYEPSGRRLYSGDWRPVGWIKGD
jgi:hypothetical protein